MLTCKEIPEVKLTLANVIAGRLKPQYVKWEYNVPPSTIHGQIKVDFWEQSVLLDW